MNLNKANLKNSSINCTKPTDAMLALPEKVLQFGTGVLLRGLIDDFIDKANRQGIFNGRVVVVKSTSTGGTDAFEQQDGLFTQLIKGIDNGNKVDEVIINSSISRVLAANEQWAEILAFAASPNLQIITSNTTEVGISLLADDDIHAAPPKSFPGKLLTVLLKRYQAFNGSVESGVVIVPTELVVDNGTKLKAIVKQLAINNKLDEGFMNWLETANDFCNSLVDRIVPGKPSAADKAAAEATLGYTDDLMIMSECYRLWAIETSSQRSKDLLSFSKADQEGIVIVSDINKFRELKLRLLNGSHTFSCGMAVVGGFTTVKEAMADDAFVGFITNMANNEISPAILYSEITLEEARLFAGKVLDRYRNPFIEHLWISISAQYTAKMKMRCIPILQKHYATNQSVPNNMALGFAAYILFMKSILVDGKFIGSLKGKEYTITDDAAGILNKYWDDAIDNAVVVESILSDKNLWDSDLTSLVGFSNAVTTYLNSID